MKTPTIQETSKGEGNPTSIDTPASSSDSSLEELRKKVETGEQGQKKSRKKRKKKDEPLYTKAGVLALLRLPFQLGGAFTGFIHDPIDPLIAEPLAESALQVLKDFGIEVVQKWINLAVFVALYGTCGVTWYKGFQAFQVVQEQARLELKKEKSGDSEKTDPGKSLHTTQ